MSKMPKLLSLLVVGLLTTTALLAGDANTANNEATETPKEDLPIVQQRSALPTGWFKPGGARSVEVPEGLQVKPAAHFDATGESSSGSSAVRNRLRRVRDAAVYDDLQQPRGGANAATTNTAASSNGTTSRNNPPPTSRSRANQTSRRRMLRISRRVRCWTATSG